MREWPRSANSTRSVTAAGCRYCLRVDFVMASGTVWSLPPMVSSSGPRSWFAVSTLSGECGENAAASDSGRAGDGIVHRSCKASDSGVGAVFAGHRHVQQLAPKGRQPRWIGTVDRDSRQAICHADTLMADIGARIANPRRAACPDPARRPGPALAAGDQIDRAAHAPGPGGSAAAEWHRLAWR